ncbi:MAG: SpoIIE family protein phosphatase [Bacteroidia bacterium]|nr:SpoIIE family protein phosphatase [Bacteroidia bacterium]
MNTRYKIFFLSLLVNTIAIAQTYDFRNFNVEDGLAQSQVLSMCQDRNGNIWFGTNSGGVSKYDGNRFINYTENDSLINNVVYSITEIKNGNILFGANGGLSIFNGQKFKSLTDKDGLPHNRVFKVLEDKNGTVWIGTGKGVCIYANNKIIEFKEDTLLSQSSVFTIYADNANNIWFGTIQNGAIKYNVSTKRFSYFNSQMGLRNNFIRSFGEDFQGNIYVGTIAGINKINGPGVIQKVNIPGEENVAFTSIIPDNKNNIWFATNEGIYKYNGLAYRKYKDKNGLASNNLLCGFRDREGNFWFGTYGYGVSKFSSEAFTSYSTKDSLPGDYVSSIFQDSKKNMWLAIKNFGVVKFNNGKFINYKIDVKNIKNSLKDNDIQAIAEDDKGKIYFGTKTGLSIFDGKTFSNYSVKDGVSDDDNIYSILIDRKKNIWVGSGNGVYKFENNKFTNITSISELKTDRGNLPVYCIFEDRSGNIWFAIENGAIKYNGNKVERFTKANGFIDKRVTTIVQDSKGHLWFGTDEGLFEYNYTRFQNISSNDGLASDKVYLLLLDGENLWAGTNKGLDKINLETYYSNNKIEIKHFGKQEGLNGVECNSNAQFKDADGNLWFGTIKGATVFNPRFDKINREEPLTRIIGIRLFFQNADEDLKQYSKEIDSLNHLPINLILPYDKNHITFDFIGVCITNPSKVKYQFKLEGADADWFPPTSKTEATYSSLPAGEYTFHLKAMNNDGIWNERAITFKFKILPPWWQTWWFYSICAIIAFSSIYSFITVRTRNLQKAKIELEQEVELRTFQLRQEKEKVEVINQEVVAQKAIIEAKNHDITDSIKYAKNIQEALLPPLQNLHKEFNDAFVLYLPKDIVSGDFYWFAKRNNKRFIASVDCTGHGVPGAFMSIVGNTLLNEIVTEKNITEPAEILNELHAGVKTALKQSGNAENERRDGMDIALCSLNEDGTILEYAGANRPLWLFRKNKTGEEAFEMIKANKFPIGGLEMENEVKRTFTNHSIPVEKGDLIYIFSDGYADQFGGEKGKKFMLGNMQKFVANIYEKPIVEQEKLLHENFLNWKGELEQIDDVLVIGFRV